MEELVEVNCHYGGEWVYNPDLEYVNGNVDTIYDFDLDFLSYIDIKSRYTNVLGFRNLKTIFVLEPGKSLNDGLFLVDDDLGIRKIINHIKKCSWVTKIDIYANHEVDMPVYANNLLDLGGSPAVNIVQNEGKNDGDTINEATYRIGDDINVQSRDFGDCYEESVAECNTNNIATQCSYVNNADTVGVGSNDNDNLDDGIGGNNTVSGIEPNKDSSERDNDQGSDNEEGEGSEDESKDERDDVSMPNIDINVREMVSYDENDEKPLFILDMTFANAEKARYAIGKYAVARGCELHLKPNEPH